MQYGSPRTTTSCIIIPNEYTSPACVPNLLGPFGFLNSSGDVHNNSIFKKIERKQIEHEFIADLF